MFGIEEKSRLSVKFSERRKKEEQEKKRKRKKGLKFPERIVSNQSPLTCNRIEAEV